MAEPTAGAIVLLVLAIRSEALAHHLKRDVPSPELILAVIQHESRGEPHVCAEDQGGSSRGLMQPWHPDSRCTPEDDVRFGADYDPATNIRAGVAVLIADFRYERRVCRHRHDPVVHYAGQGPKAVKAAREIRDLARKIRKKGLQQWRTIT